MLNEYTNDFLHGTGSQKHVDTVFFRCIPLPYEWASQVALMIKNPPANPRDTGSIPGWGRLPGEGNSNPLQYSRLENPMGRGAWRATVHGVTKGLDTTYWPNNNSISTCVLANLGGYSPLNNSNLWSEWCTRRGHRPGNEVSFHRCLDPLLPAFFYNPLNTRAEGSLWGSDHPPDSTEGSSAPWYFTGQ